MKLERASGSSFPALPSEEHISGVNGLYPQTTGHLIAYDNPQGQRHLDILYKKFYYKTGTSKSEGIILKRFRECSCFSLVGCISLRVPQCVLSLPINPLQV